MTTGISRRTWLLRAAVGGAALALGMAPLRNALAADPVEKGVSRVQGDVRINGKPAQQGMAVKPGDTIDTGRDAELVLLESLVGRKAPFDVSGC